MFPSVFCNPSVGNFDVSLALNAAASKRDTWLISYIIYRVMLVDQNVISPPTVHPARD